MISAAMTPTNKRSLRCFSIGPMLTFLNVNAYWEQAIQGVIILVAAVAAISTQRRA